MWLVCPGITSALAALSVGAPLAVAAHSFHSSSSSPILDICHLCPPPGAVGALLSPVRSALCRMTCTGSLTGS